MPAKIKISTKTGFNKINTEFNKSEEIIEPSLLMISQRARRIVAKKTGKLQSTIKPVIEKKGQKALGAVVANTDYAYEQEKRKPYLSKASKQLERKIIKSEQKEIVKKIKKGRV